MFPIKFGEMAPYKTGITVSMTIATDRIENKLQIHRVWGITEKDITNMQFRTT